MYPTSPNPSPSQIWAAYAQPQLHKGNQANQGARVTFHWCRSFAMVGQLQSMCNDQARNPCNQGFPLCSWLDQTTFLHTSTCIWNQNALKWLLVMLHKHIALSWYKDCWYHCDLAGKHQMAAVSLLHHLSVLPQNHHLSVQPPAVWALIAPHSFKQQSLLTRTKAWVNITESSYCSQPWE